MPFFRRDKTRKLITEVEVVRTKITLACTECQRRNYNIRTEWKPRSIVDSARLIQFIRKPNSPYRAKEL